MKWHYFSACGSAALGLLIGGCTTPSPFDGSLEQTAPLTISEKLHLPEGAEPAFVISGLQQGAIPQGMTYLPDSMRFLTSHYFDNGNPSCIVSTDWKSGKAITTFQLLEPDGSEHTGHVGGLATDGTSLWIASDKHLFRGDLSGLHDSEEPATFQTLEKIRTEATEEAAFCSVFDNLIWTGEFALGSKFSTHASHKNMARDGQSHSAWLCGHDPSKGFKHPEKIISIPDRTQGAIASGSHIILSRSYGRRNPGSLEIYSNPLKENPHKSVETSTGQKAPLWFLDSKNLIRTIELPPMSENICIHDGYLYILFESGARKFRWFGKPPLDYVLKLKLEEILR